MTRRKRAPNSPSGNALPPKKKSESPSPRLRLKLYRDPETQIDRVTLTSPLFEEDWQNGLASAAASTGLEILGSSRTLDAVAAFGEKMTSALSKFLDGILQGSELACRAGCDHCCHQIVGATWPEVLSIAQYLQALPDPQRLALKEKVEVAAAKAQGRSPAERFSPMHPCPFLDAGSCTVYPVRPLACRGVHALDSEVCRAILRTPKARQRFLETGQGSPSYREPGRAVHSLSAGMQLCLSEIFGLDMRPVDLTLALARIFTDPALAQGWFKGEASPPDIRAGHGSESPDRHAITGERSSSG